MNSPDPSPCLPPAILAELDGACLESKSDHAFALATISAEGWPRTAYLSAGEVLALDEARIAFALWPQSSAVDNLARHPRATLSLVSAGAICELRLDVRHCSTPDPTVALFLGTLVSCRTDRAPYADVLQGVTFRLHDLPATLTRWRQQLEWLRDVG